RATLFGQGVEQRTSATTFVRLERGEIVAVPRAASMERHQHVDVEGVVVLLAGQVGGAQVVAEDRAAQEFVSRQRGLEVRPRLIQAVLVYVKAGQPLECRGLPVPIFDVARERQ